MCTLFVRVFHNHYVIFAAISFRFPFLGNFGTTTAHILQSAFDASKPIPRPIFGACTVGGRVSPLQANISHKNTSRIEDDPQLPGAPEESLP
jgi:hypothetical protein